jgi:hypothetical protein
VRSQLSSIVDAILGPIVQRKLQQPIRASAGNLTQADVEKIAEGCGAPLGSVRIDGADLLVFPNQDIMVTGRLLKALQATGETSLTAISNQKHRISGEGQ